MAIARTVAATLAAAAFAIPILASREGFVVTTYADLNGKPTYCFGSTLGAVRGKTYTDAECAAALSQDAIRHGLEIAKCLPADLPAKTRGAFISIAYNTGTNLFCKSSMSRQALAGDLPKACAAISLYVYSGGRKLRGLELRRIEERALCEAGIKEAL